MSLLEDQEKRIAALEAKLARLEMRGPLAGVMSQQLAATNTVADVLRVERTTSGTAADGIGAGVVFVVQDASGNKDEAARIDAVLTTAAHATEVAALKLYVLGVLAATLDGTGNLLIPTRGLHVGGTSDPGDNNLLVDGTGAFNGAVVTGAQLSVNGAWAGVPSATVKGIANFWDSASNYGIGFGEDSASPYGMWIQAIDIRSGQTGTVPLLLQPLAGGVHIGGTSDPGTDNLIVDGTGIIAGLVTVGTGADTAQVLKLNTERPWAFRQTSTGATSRLQLIDTTGSKSFDIASSNGTAVMTVRPEDTASTGLLQMFGRLVHRTAASDPQHATAGSRPAGNVGEIVYYSGKMYFCTNAATPTWEKITSA